MCFKRKNSRVRPLSARDFLLSFVTSHCPTPIVTHTIPAERSAMMIPRALLIHQRSLRLATRDSVQVLRDLQKAPRSSVTLPRSSVTLPKSFGVIPDHFMRISFPPETPSLLTPVALRINRRRSFRPDMFPKPQTPMSKDKISLFNLSQFGRNEINESPMAASVHWYLFFW